MRSFPAGVLAGVILAAGVVAGASWMARPPLPAVVATGPAVAPGSALELRAALRAAGYRPGPSCLAGGAMLETWSTDRPASAVVVQVDAGGFRLMFESRLTVRGALSR